MNRFAAMGRSARNFVRSHTRNVTAGAGLSLALVAPAFATGESTQIIAAFTEYKTEAVLALIGFILVLWAIKATGLLKPRG